MSDDICASCEGTIYADEPLVTGVSGNPFHDRSDCRPEVHAPECAACAYERWATGPSDQWSDEMLAEYQDLLFNAECEALCDEHIDGRPEWWTAFRGELRKRGIDNLLVPDLYLRTGDDALLPPPIARMLYAYDRLATQADEACSGRKAR